VLLGPKEVEKAQAQMLLLQVVSLENWQPALSFYHLLETRVMDQLCCGLLPILKRISQVLPQI
jgi:hypothetical protein